MKLHKGKWNTGREEVINIGLQQDCTVSFILFHIELFEISFL